MKNNLKSYWRYFRPHTLKIILAFLLTVISTSGNFVTTHTLSVIVDKVSNANFTGIWILLIVLLLIELGSKIASHVSAKAMLNLKTKIVTQLRFRILKQIATASIESVEKNDPVDLATRSSEDTNIFVNAIHAIY